MPDKLSQISALSDLFIGWTIELVLLELLVDLMPNQAPAFALVAEVVMDTHRVLCILLLSHA